MPGPEPGRATSNGKRLHLPTIRRLFGKLAVRAEEEQMGYRTDLEILMSEEIAHRVKEVRGRATAMCGFGLTDQDPSEAFFWGMFVAPDQRGQGVGTQLMTELKRLLAVLGAERIRAKVAAPNDGAIHFYRALGFRIGERVGWLREGSDVPVHALETTLEPVST